MTDHSAVFKRHILKPFFMVSLINVCAGFNKSAVQSVVGQWKQVAVNAYCTHEAIQNSHGHLQTVMEMPKVDATEDFHSNNTFVATILPKAKESYTPAPGRLLEIRYYYCKWR